MRKYGQVVEFPACCWLIAQNIEFWLNLTPWSLENTSVSLIMIGITGTEAYLQVGPLATLVISELTSAVETALAFETPKIGKLGIGQH